MRLLDELGAHTLGRHACVGDELLGFAARCVECGAVLLEQLRGLLAVALRAGDRFLQRLLTRARQEIESEKSNAIAQLRREAVDLAIAGAGKVIDRNLDQAANRQLVESFLASVTPAAVSASR